MAQNVAHVGLNIQCYNKHQQQLDASEGLMKTNQAQVTRNQDLQELHEKNFARLLDLVEVSDAQKATVSTHLIRRCFQQPLSC